MHLKNPSTGRLLAALSLTALLAGCAVGNKHAYHDANASTATRTDKSVAVASLDQRQYVVSGKSTPDFVGMQRGGFGNPFDVLTVSGRPLAGEFSDAIKGALARNNVNVVTVDTKPAADNKTAVTNLVATHRDRLVLVNISEWVADTFNNTTLSYDLRLSVADASGKEIAAKTLRADLELGGSLMNPPGHAKEVIPPTFRKTIEEMLNSPEVVAALK